VVDPEAGQTLLAALEPLARLANAQDARSGGQRRADALAELARRSLEAGRLPQSGGARPQLLVTVDLDSLLGHPGGLGGEVGGAWPLDPETCRRLACDGAVTRVLVTRQPPGHGGRGGDHDHGGHQQERRGDHDHHPDHGDHDRGRGRDAGLADPLRTAATRLPPTLGGAPTQPLEVGRTSRVVTPAQRAALSSATAAVASPAASGPRPGARPTISAIGCTAAPPTSRTWPCCAGPTTGRSMRAAGDSPATPTAA
jgi:hypothetical protein